jgi:hypothetical protein
MGWPAKSVPTHLTTLYHTECCPSSKTSRFPFLHSHHPNGYSKPHTALLTGILAIISPAYAKCPCMLNTILCISSFSISLDPSPNITSSDGGDGNGGTYPFSVPSPELILPVDSSLIVLDPSTIRGTRGTDSSLSDREPAPP